MNNKAKIKEIFTSIQGEGPFVGTKQLFIRFCGCNLNCDYCDTDFTDDENSKSYTAEELKNYIKSLKLENIHSISLTGGEPLVWADFLKEFIIKMNSTIYLETNATLSHKIDQLGEAVEFIDIVSADIKLPSCSGIQDSFEEHDRFFNAMKNAKISCAVHGQFDCDKKLTFAKIVFDEKITNEEIVECCKLAKKYDLLLILQPKMNGNELGVSTEKMIEITDKFLSLHKNVRIIPQVHKFLDLR